MWVSAIGFKIFEVACNLDVSRDVLRWCQALFVVYMALTQFGSWFLDMTC